MKRGFGTPHIVARRPLSRAGVNLTQLTIAAVLPALAACGCAHETATRSVRVPT
jgi:hypothetical protein